MKAHTVNLNFMRTFLKPVLKLKKEVLVFFSQSRYKKIPVFTQILEEGVKDGSLHTETPKESSEMIVAMLTFLLNSSFFPSDDESTCHKLKLYANVLEPCLETEKGSFSFLFTNPV